MKVISVLFLLIFAFSAAGQGKPLFSNLKYDKVVMYDFEPSGEKGGSIVENGHLTTVVKKQASLEKSATLKLNSKLMDRNSFNWRTAACFDPYLGLVYYKANKITGYMTICLSCNRLYASFDLPAQKRDKNRENDAVGMSKSFRQFLNQLLKKYNFSHQITPGSGFDE